MDRHALHYDACFDSNKPSGHQARCDPESHLEIELLEDPRIEKEDGVFRDSHRNCIDCFVHITRMMLEREDISQQFGRFGINSAHNIRNQSWAASNRAPRPPRSSM